MIHLFGFLLDSLLEIGVYSFLGDSDSLQNRMDFQEHFSSKDFYATSEITAASLGIQHPPWKLGLQHPPWKLGLQQATITTTTIIIIIIITSSVFCLSSLLCNAPQAVAKLASCLAMEAKEPSGAEQLHAKRMKRHLLPTDIEMRQRWRWRWRMEIGDWRLGIGAEPAEKWRLQDPSNHISRRRRWSCRSRDSCSARS
jgi:hypothetical protein